MQVFVSVSSPDGTTTTGPFYAGLATTAGDASGPLLSSATAIAAPAVAPTAFTLGGLQLDSPGLAYVMVVQPLSQQQVRMPSHVAHFLPLRDL